MGWMLMRGGAAGTGDRRARPARVAGGRHGRRADSLAGAQAHGRACERAHGRLGQRVRMTDARANTQEAGGRAAASARARGWVCARPEAGWDSAHQLRLCDAWSRKATGPGRRMGGPYPSATMGAAAGGDDDEGPRAAALREAARRGKARKLKKGKVRKQKKEG